MGWTWLEIINPSLAVLYRPSVIEPISWQSGVLRMSDANHHYTHRLTDTGIPLHSHWIAPVSRNPHRGWEATFYRMLNRMFSRKPVDISFTDSFFRITWVSRYSPCIASILSRRHFQSVTPHCTHNHSPHWTWHLLQDAQRYKISAKTSISLTMKLVSTHRSKTTFDWK